MTLQQAKEILKTYKLPLTPEQTKLYLKALALVSGSFALPPQL